VPPADQIENPDPYPGSNNWYKVDGFFLGDTSNESNAAYVNCSDSSQPGVASIMNYLTQLPYRSFHSGNCATGAYYLVNNQVPAYDRNGTLLADQTYSVGPSSVPTIGDTLSAAGVSWRYYGEGFLHTGLGDISKHYCGICNPFQYSKSIMTTSLKSNIKDLLNFYSDLSAGTLPAVSFIKPDDIVDGHPGTSFPALYEAFAKKIVEAVQQQPAIWAETAIFITTDESGALYDSGYIQPLDYFGDGPRIPLIVASPFSKTGFVDHTYTDHASLLKFVEANWGLKPISSRSRDNLPNPKHSPAAPYFPRNSPAIGDLMTLFNFPK
jgi:phospholipase C